LYHGGVSLAAYRSESIRQNLLCICGIPNCGVNGTTCRPSKYLEQKILAIVARNLYIQDKDQCDYLLQPSLCQIFLDIFCPLRSGLSAPIRNRHHGYEVVTLVILQVLLAVSEKTLIDGSEATLLTIQDIPKKSHWFREW
jgi:hypothetical protein